MKLHSSRLRKSKWRLTLPLAEARRNDEIISIASSQIFRWLDELNGITDAEDKVHAIRSEIKRIRKEPNTIQNRKRVKQLYADLDELQFKPDYMCLIVDKDKDYRRACKGFTINGVRYHRLLGTNGGVKNKTIVFISDKHGDEIRKRIENNRNPNTELVPAKLEAYKALACSASVPVSMPSGVLVVDDCETQFRSDIIYLDDANDGEPTMEYRDDELVSLDESDGYGLMLPALAERWSEELELGYVTSGVNTRMSWTKGMVFTFDFLDFAEKVAGQYVVRDAWGNDVDIRQVELILTTSMLKLWDSYDSCESYLRSCEENHYSFGVAKTCPKELENEHTLNYQFIQPIVMSDEHIEELIGQTVQRFHDVLADDPIITTLFLKGIGLNEENIDRLRPDYGTALMIEPSLINDPHTQSSIYQTIKNRIDQAKVGVIPVHGNYSIISGDPFALCQHIFCLPVTGLLNAGEIYNEYWLKDGATELACFRAPMSCAENIRKVSVCRSAEAQYWFQYMHTCTALNAWDTTCAALNGADKDGDLIMLTDNAILVNQMKELPAIMCAQRKAAKRIVTEEDSIQANIDSFGDDIGAVTNRITSMYEVRSLFAPESEERKVLDYRIRQGQLYQQNSIDKAKGIICKPMPKEWYDRHAVNQIEDPDKRRFYLGIVADRKPYFMRYIYPALMRDYNTYLRNTNKSCLREFQMTVDELQAIPESERTERQSDYLRYYSKRMPVGLGDCVMNRICRRFEVEFDGHVGRHNASISFDYTIMKSDAEYSKAQFYAVKKLYDNYNRRLQNYKVFRSYERVDDDEAVVELQDMKDEFVAECTKVCSNRMSLCNIVLDICYQKSATRSFAWDICGEEIIENLLRRNDRMISYPVADPNGDILYGGMRFTKYTKEVSFESVDRSQ